MGRATHDPISVAILAGGRSRRMGQDKALLLFLGRPLIARVIETAKTLSDDLFIVASDRPAYARFGVPLEPDRFPDAGSLGGIYSGISRARHDACLVVACDMPFLNRRLLEHMARVERAYDVLVPALAAERSDQGAGETLETLHAIYTKRCLGAIERRLRAGRYKITGFFDDVRVQRIPEDEVRRLDPELLSFFNANTPEEWSWALARAARRQRDRA